MQNTNSKEYMNSSVHCNAIAIAKIWKQLKCLSVDEWRKQQQYIHTVEYYLGIKKKEILPFARAWMDLESIMLS